MLKHLSSLTVEKIYGLCGDHQRLKQFLSSLTKQELAELLALMWQGRDDFTDGRIPFSEQLSHAVDDIDSNTPSYIADKHSVLPGYLRNGLRLLDEERNGNLDSAKWISPLES